MNQKRIRPICNWRAVAGVLLATAAWMDVRPVEAQSTPKAGDMIRQAKYGGDMSRKVANDPDAEGKNIVDIEIVGNKTISRERILSQLKTYPNREYKAETVAEDLRKLYGTHWFYDIDSVTRNVDDGVVVVYRVIERPTIQSVKYFGNVHMKEKKLKELTGLQVGKAMDPGLNKAMARRIEDEYRKKGYPYAVVELEEGGKSGDSNVVIRITEGPKTKVAEIDISGNTFVSSARLKTKLASKPRILYFIGGKYDPDKVNDDVAKLTEYYRDFGYLDVRIGRKVDWNEDKSLAKLSYVIDEGPRYKVRDVDFDGNRIFDNDELSGKLLLTSGKYFNSNALERDNQAVQDTYGKNGYIHAMVNPDVKYLEEPGIVDISYSVKEDKPHRIGAINITGNEITKRRVILSRMELNPDDIADTTMLRLSQQRLIESRLFQTDPQSGQMPTVTFDQTNDPDAEEQDVAVNVTEGQTGSLMFGVGVNSNSGLGGSLVLNERNFDILRLPRSWDDITGLRAFRGAGQEFQMQLVPGTQVNSFNVSFTEPRLLGMKYSLSTSGYLYTRVFNSYYEQRGGGRFALGKRFTAHTGGSVTYRIENINISNPATPTPPDITSVLGGNFLQSFRVALDNDTRDSNMAPGKGHFVEAAYEQAFGDFDFPRVTLSGRQFWTILERADGSGKHVLTARGDIGYSGSSTPVFERFYAGGFNSIRGFQFRGVGPTVNGIEVGGDFMLTGGLEYQLPLTADDNLGWVFFCDTGTVESKTEILDYRVTAGFGLRVKMPQLAGPVPLAFDFGFPIVQNPNDDRQVFSFFLGMFR